MDDKKDPPAEEAGLGANLWKVLSFPGGVVKDAADVVLNTSRFLTSSQYRREIGYPWLKETVVQNKNAVWKEISQSDEMLRLMWRYSCGGKLTDEEQDKVREQLLDLAKVVPALGIFALPGGAVLLPMLARVLPWDLLPSAFREKEGISEEEVEEIGRGESPKGSDSEDSADSQTP